MTCLLVSSLLAASLASGITYGEESVNDLKGTAIVATITAGDMNSVDYAAWQVLGATLLDGASSYTRRSIYSFGSQNGVMPDVLVWPGVMQVRFESPPSEDGVRVIADLLAKVVQSPTIPDSSIPFATRRITQREPTVWERVLAPVRPQGFAPTAIEVRKLHAEAFRPQEMSIHVAGPLGQGSVQGAITPRFQDWKVKTLPRLQSSDRKPDEPKMTGEHCLTTWASQPKRNLYDLATQMVTVCALGGGKSSLLHSTIRQKNRWGYLQEATWSPSRAGWHMTVFTVQPRPEHPEARAEEIKLALTEGVQTWKDEDVVRAKRLALTSLEGVNPVHPFWLTPSARLDTSPMARASLLGWSRVHGNDVSIGKLQLALEAVTLDDVRAAAKALFESKPMIQTFD